MNKFDELEAVAASQVIVLVTSLVTEYARPEDSIAACIAVLMRAIEVAGGAAVLAKQEREQ